MAESERIEDFGQKIGGAKKDLWKSRNLELSDVTDWTAIEREKFITKKQVWKAPDYQKLVDDGLPRRVAFFIKQIHDNLPAKPYSNNQEYQDGYISFVSDVRERAMKLKTDDDVQEFLSSLIQDYYMEGRESYGCLTRKLIRTPDTAYQLDRKIREKQFLYTEEEKALSKYAIFEYDGTNIDFDDSLLIFHRGSSKYYSYRNEEKFFDKRNWNVDTFCLLTGNNQVIENNFETKEAAKAFAVQREKELSKTQKQTEKKERKKRFVPAQLANVERTGEDYRIGKDITGDDMLQTFGFYGGEFGNWESQNERQHNLNYSYEAFKDLAAALGIKDSDISLDGKLSIAYGARGIGNALAHFEPERNVINLTKMKGAGSLAHEWGHALDFFLASKFDSRNHYITESRNELIKPILDAMEWRTQSIEEVRTQRKADSEKYRSMFSSNVKGNLKYDNRSTAEQNMIDSAIEKCFESFTAEEQKKHMRNEGTPEYHSILNELTEKLGESSLYYRQLDDAISIAFAYADENYPIQPRKVRSEFAKDSAEMDKLYSKSDKGYWSSSVEMFARAFACYVSDKLAPEQSDYLCGHAETAVGAGKNGEPIYAYPRGEERESINAAFDNLIETLKEREILHKKEIETEQTIEDKSQDIANRNAARKEKLIQIAGKIGYNTAIQRLQQGLNDGALQPQETAFRQDVIEELKNLNQQKNSIPFHKSKVYNETVKKTPEEIEQANYVNLPQFLMSHGVELKRVGKEYIMKEHDSVHIQDNEPNEIGKWFQFSRNKGGDNIAFVQEFFGKSFHEAVDMLNGGRTVSLSHQKTVQEQKPQKNQEIDIQPHSDAKRAIAYLSQTRGLDYNIIRNLVQQGKLLQEEKTGNAVFLIEDENGKTVGAEKTGTSTSHKYKGIAAGSTSSYGFEICKGKGENALFFESAIDLLSYFQMHEKELNNHRLISMMGVKPSVVEATMQRYDISPENVYLCSDNDEAGNSFANRLMEKYPQMKRLKADSQYKDWNDQIRNIPITSEKENVQTIENKKLVSYGNLYWNTATDNKDKTLFQMSEETFLQYREKLDNAGMNYYAFAKNGMAVAAVHDKEADKFKDLIGRENSDKLQTRKSAKAYTPPEKNIIGNTEYRYIPQKSYITAGTQTILKMAELLEQENIKFSAKIGGYSSTMTVSAADREKAETIKEHVLDMRKSYLKSDRQQEKELVDSLSTSVDSAEKMQYTMSMLTVGDVIKLPPDTVLDRNMQSTLIPETYGRVTSVDENQISLTTYSDPDLMFETGKAGYLNNWAEQFEKMGVQYIGRYEDITAVNEQQEKTALEQAFLDYDVESVMAKSPLAWDEIEDIGYILFEEGYINKHNASEKSIYGNGLHEPDLYDIARRMQDGEDIRKELAVALLGGQKNFTTANDNEFVVEYGENDITAKYGNVEKSVSYEAVGDALISLISREYNSIVHDRTVEDLTYSIPDLTNETAEQLITAFDNARMADWQGDFIKETKIKKALYDILDDDEKTEKAFASIADMKYNYKVPQSESEPERADSLSFTWGKDKDWFTESGILADFAEKNPEISFALANALFEYLDEKQHTERDIPELKAGWYKKTDFVISGVIGGENFNYDGRFDIGDGKGTGGGRLIDHIRYINHGIIDSDNYPYNTPESKEKARKALDIFVPFLESHSELTAEEQRIFEDFKEQNPIRTLDDIEKAQGKFKIYQLPGGDKYHGIHFEGMEQLKKNGVQLGHDDYELVYEGIVGEFKGNATLEGIFTQFNTNQPTDFTGNSLSVSDVIVISADGKDTAYFCDSFGFTEMPEFFRKKEKMQEQSASEITQDKSTVTLETEKSFAQQVDEVLAGKADRYNNIKVCDTPQILLDVGCEQLPMLYTQRHLRNAVKPKNLKEHTHGLSVEQLKKMPELLNEPVMIYDSLSRNDSLIVVTSEFDIANNPIIISVHPNGSGEYNLERVNSNFVTSIYGRENFVKHLEKEIEADNLLYADKEKSQELFSVLGLQFSKGLNNLDFNTIIHPSRNIVKELEEKSLNADENREEKHIGKNEQTIDLISDVSEVQDISSAADVPAVKLKYKEDNFTITDDALGEGGAKTKFRANIDAIRTLKILEKENRPATAEEQETLSKYVGWGGLPQAFDINNEKWSKEFAELKELLTSQEYSAANASVLDAYYTPPVVIDSIYEAAARFGFDGGNVLEPSCGVGNFIGKMPEDMRKESKVYGVELDIISGRIAQKLYPDADIQVKGFEKTDFQDSCFDLAVGNVPFGDIGFFDKQYGAKQLHDYFFAKTLDLTKDGGVIAFITSTGTMDKANEDFRRQLSEKADLIGAIRLPSGTFSKNAGTDVASDIVFLQKRSEPPEVEPEWVHIGTTENGLPVNQYFAEHPDMILGEMAEGNKLYGRGTTCIPFEGADLKEQLAEAVSKLTATISDIRANDVYQKVNGIVITPPEQLRNYSFFEQDNNIYFKTTDKVCEARCNHKNKDFKAVKAFIELRDTTRELLTAQEQDKPDGEIQALQNKLSTQYDAFQEKHGLLHSKRNKSLLSDDVSYNLVATLEKNYDLSKGTAEKSDIFTKRTIKPPKAVDHVDTAIEALTISMAEKAHVDIGYMQLLTGESKDELLQDLRGELFLVPSAGEDTYQTKAEYLSGDIYQKLAAAEEAAKTDSRFELNVQALKEAKPPLLKAEDIDIQIGASWIAPKVYQQFMYEMFGTAEDKRIDKLQQTIAECQKKIEEEPFYRRYSLQRQLNTAEKSMKSAIQITHSETSGEWSVTPKPTRYSNLSVHEQEYSTKHKSAYQIMEDLLNLREPKCYKTVTEQAPDGSEKEKRVIDDKATKAAHLKAEKIKGAFKEWIFQDPERRNALVEQYNRMFNCIRPREYDGSSLSFPTMNKDIELRPHQKDAIAHALFGGNTLFAHTVGAGKTFEMIATAMESKRLGLCNKPMLCVPKQLTEQIGEDFRLLYPNSNILVATAKDFEKSNRQQLFAKIATGDFDAVIISHQQLGNIPLSQERQIAILEQQLDNIVKGIAEAKERDGSSVEVKALERSRKSVKKKLDALLDKPKDDTVTFEEMGIDKLIVDEGHEFKNLFTATRLQGISGISTSSSQKAMDLFMKCQYLDEKTGGKGIVMATGTPLSNSMTELHVMMRYLEYDFLKEKGLDSFDNWISVFGKQQSDWQLNTTGSDVKQKVHMSYTGIPELMSMFKQIADIRTADMLDLDVPECEMHVVQVEPTEEQKDMLQELSDRADALQNRVITDPRIDNPLKITGDGRKLALDPRLIDPTLEDNPDTKLNQCVENVYSIYKETASDKLTQIIFCDLGVPSGSSKTENTNDEKSAAERESLEEECDFCVYDDIKKKLIEKGVNPDEIAYIHSAKNEKDKEELFSKVRSGEVRVLLGSTSKMGTGVNVQKKLIAVHDLDIPWRPADMEQRRGRLVRQGNENKQVHQYRYVTKGTFDAYSYQLLESKQRFISQIMTSDAISRSAEDVDQQALNYSEIKALCVGDERLKQRADLENEVANMRIQKREHDSRIYEMQDLISAYPKTKSSLETMLENLKIDKSHAAQLPVDPENNRPVFSITIGGEKYTDRKQAADALRKTIMSQINVKDKGKSIEVGEFMGFPLTVSVNDMSAFSGSLLSATLHGTAKHSCDFVDSYDTNLRRMESAVFKIDRRIENTVNELNDLEIDYENALKIVSEPFELKSKDGRTLSEMETSLKDLTEELAKSAAKAKKENPDKPRTCYFERAKLRKNAEKIAKQERSSGKDKAKGTELE